MKKTTLFCLALIVVLLTSAHQSGCRQVGKGSPIMAYRDDKDFNLAIFKHYADSMVVNTMGAADSMIMQKDFGGNIAAYKENKKTYAIVNSKRNTRWSSIDQYLLMDTAIAKEYALRIGIDSAWYFLKFLRFSTITHPLKTEIISYVRDTAYKKYHEPILLNCDANYLLSWVQYRESEYLRKRHAEAHRRPKEQD
jgi:hypothetical protein